MHLALMERWSISHRRLIAMMLTIVSQSHLMVQLPRQCKHSIFMNLRLKVMIAAQRVDTTTLTTVSMDHLMLLIDMWVLLETSQLAEIMKLQTVWSLLTVNIQPLERVLLSMKAKMISDLQWEMLDLALHAELSSWWNPQKALPLSLVTLLLH